MIPANITAGGFGKQQQGGDMESPTRPPMDTRPLPETVGSPTEVALQQLQVMGFPRQRAASALAASSGDVMAAANMLAGDERN